MDAALGQDLSEHPFQDGALNGLWDKLRKALAAEHLPGAADGVGGQRNHRKVLIHAVFKLPDFFQRLHAVKPGHHVVQEHDVIGSAAAQRHRFPSAQAGVHLNPIASQNALGHHQVHLLVVHRQSPDAHAGEGLPARGLILREAPFSGFPIQKVRHGKRGEGLVHNRKPAFPAQVKLPLRDYDDPDGFRQFLIICGVLHIFRLYDKHMGQLMAALHLEKALKIMYLVALRAKPHHQALDQAVIVLPDLVAAVLFRPEIARNAKLLRVVELNARPLVRHALGNHDMRGQTLLFSAGEVKEAAHGVQKPLGDGKPEAQAAREAAAAGIRLVKHVVHLRQLGTCHADAGVPDINDQIDAIAFPAAAYADVYAALLRKFNGVFHQDFEHMGNFLRIPHQGRRHLRVDVKHQLQVLAVALQRGHGNDVVQHRGDHVFFFGGSQRALHNLRIVQHIVNLVGQALPRHFDGGHVRPDIRGELLPQRHLADSDDHVDGGAELMGYVGQKDGVLLSRRLQLRKYPVIPLPLRIPPVDPVQRQRRASKGHDDAKRQVKRVLETYPMGNGTEDQAMIRQHQRVQGRRRVQNPLLVQHKQRQNQNAGHGGQIKKTGFMHTEKEEFDKHQSSA